MNELNSDLKVPGGSIRGSARAESLVVLKKIRPLLNKDIAIIASGGIMSKELWSRELKQVLHWFKFTLV